MSKQLGHVADRLSLLGYTLASCRQTFEQTRRDEAAYDNAFLPQPCSFSTLETLFRSTDSYSSNASFQDPRLHYLSDDHRKILGHLAQSKSGDSIADWKPIADALEQLGPYSLLQLIALNPISHSLPVVWDFADVVEGGWADRGGFVRSPILNNRFLVVTEGSSDSKVLRHAFKLLKPHLADFFYYIDMQSGYPFSGTGNMFRFLQGIVSLPILNHTLFVYDNDAEGVFNHGRSSELMLPDNVVVMKLPNCLSLTDIETVGPSGRHRTDINGRAAAIECYLDLGSNPVVRWISYNKALNSYHGVLEEKEHHLRRFLRLRIRSRQYDFTRIEAVLDAIIDTCVSCREKTVEGDVW